MVWDGSVRVYVFGWFWWTEFDRGRWRWNDLGWAGSKGDMRRRIGCIRSWSCRGGLAGFVRERGMHRRIRFVVGPSSGYKKERVELTGQCEDLQTASCELVILHGAKNNANEIGMLRQQHTLPHGSLEKNPCRLHVGRGRGGIRWCWVMRDGRVRDTRMLFEIGRSVESGRRAAGGRQAERFPGTTCTAAAARRRQ